MTGLGGGGHMFSLKTLLYFAIILVMAATKVLDQLH